MDDRDVSKFSIASYLYKGMLENKTNTLKSGLRY